VIKLWNVKDAYFIKKEFLLILATNLPLALIWGLLLFTQIVSHLVPYAIILFIIFIDHIFCVVVPIFLTGKMKNLLRQSSLKIRRSKLNLEQIAGSGDPLVIVLENKKLRQSFEEFCVQSFCVERYSFFPSPSPSPSPPFSLSFVLSFFSVCFVILPGPCLILFYFILHIL